MVVLTGTLERAKGVHAIGTLSARVLGLTLVNIFTVFFEVVGIGTGLRGGSTDHENSGSGFESCLAGAVVFTRVWLPGTHGVCGAELSLGFTAGLEERLLDRILSDDGRPRDQTVLVGFVRDAERRNTSLYQSDFDVLSFFGLLYDENHLVVARQTFALLVHFLERNNLNVSDQPTKGPCQVLIQAADHGFLKCLHDIGIFFFFVQELHISQIFNASLNVIGSVILASSFYINRG